MISLRASLLLMTGLILVDQLIKNWVRGNVPLHRSTVLIPHLIDFTHVENRGVSFSILGNLDDSLRVPLLVTVSLVAVSLLAGYWLRHRAGMNAFTELAFVLILPGAVGNLIDRALFGTVTDYLHFRFYETSLFVNNFADILISAGVVAYLVGSLAGRRPEPVAS